MANGIFGDMFDFNNDGNLDAFEQGLEFIFLDQLTKEESDVLTELMIGVVNEGTATKLKSDLYQAAGKTGSAEYNGVKEDSHAWFTGFAPAEDPVIMTLVIIDEPKGTYYGGAIAGPVMKEVLENALPYLGIEPNYNEQEQTLDEVQKLTVPNFVDMTVNDAKKYASEQEITIDIQGEGKTIVSRIERLEEFCKENMGRFLLCGNKLWNRSYLY